jgi:hypothetical protein
MDSLDAVLKDAWQYAEPASGSKYDFHNEFFVFHMYAHMAYHFFSGGCGIRSLLDIWIMEHNMGLEFNCAEVLLKKAGIYTFAQEMSNIANHCFSDLDSSDQILSYIWRGGVYGSKRNHIAVQKRKDGSSCAYILKRFFMPYSSMLILYPILKKLPILLPFCWLHRAAKIIMNGKSANIAKEMVCVNQISRDELDEISKICMRLGF